MAICLIDFDSTCVFSGAGNAYCLEDTGAAKVLRQIVKKGHKLVLWTCRNSSKNNPFNYTASGKYREEDSLQEAKRWFRERRIPLYGINCVPGSEESIGDSRKPLADFVIDDVNIGTPIIKKTVDCIEYETGKTVQKYLHCVDWKKMKKLLKEKDLI